MKAIDEAVPPTTKIELQSLLGKINFIRRSISNLSERVLSFSPLLKLKNDHEFKWGDVQQKVFEEIKEYMNVHLCWSLLSKVSLLSCTYRPMTKQLDWP